MAKLDLANIIRVTIMSALRGLANANTSALAIITSETPIPSGFTYGIYKNPQGVAADFGSASKCYRLAVKVFSQTPNILTGGGYLIIINRQAAAAAQPAVILPTGPVNLLALAATNYTIRAAVDGGSAANILIGELDLTDLASAEASLNAYTVETAGLIFELSGSLASTYVKLKTDTEGASSAIVLSAATSGTDIAPLLNLAGSATGAASGTERIKDCILRTYGSLDYFGIILDEKPADALLLETAGLVQTLDKMLFVASSTSGDIAGVFTDILEAGYTHTRCLYYSTALADALDFAAGYAGRALSINFSGSNTAHTMHMKDITGLIADDGSAMTEAVLTACGNAGVDIYPSFGVAKVFTSGANQFFDQVYSSLAFKLRLQIAAFNYIAQTPTKITQTEQGMSGYKGALRKVCQAFVTAGVFAPGTWLDSTTFGDPEDHIRNIKDTGYYVYSLPIAGQTAEERATRAAPSTMIAAKASGAIHSSDIVAYFEN
jgi:hypothetical protein